MKLLHCVWLLACVLCVPFTINAAPAPEVQVDYSADSTMETEGGMTIKSKIYHKPNMDRTEMGGADGMTSIVRKDKKVIWQLMGDMYMEMPMDDSNASGMDVFEIVEQTEVGQETVNGMKTTKSKVVAVKKDGSGKFGGFFWTTKEGITVKMDMLSKDGDRKMRMTSELTNIKLEKQDPALFEIPAGYTKNDMGAMMGQMMGGARSQDRGRGHGAKKPKTEEGEPALDVNKMMKGLFGK